MEIQITVLSVPKKAQNYWQETRLVWRGQRAKRIWEPAWLCHFFPVPSSSGLWEEKYLPSWRTRPHLSPLSAGFCHISFLIWILPPLPPPLWHIPFFSQIRVKSPILQNVSTVLLTLVSCLNSFPQPYLGEEESMAFAYSFFVVLFYHSFYTFYGLIYILFCTLIFFFVFNGTVRSFLSVH